MINGWVIFLGEVFLGVLAGTLIGAVILKTSCILYNMLAAASLKSFSRQPLRTPAPTLETRTTLQPGSIVVLNDDWSEHESTDALPGIPVPSFEWAMCIIFFNALLQLLVCFIVLRVLRLAGQVAGMDALRTTTFYLIFGPLSVLILSGLNTAMLPTSFGRALLVSLIHLFLSALTAAFVLIVLSLIGYAFGLSLFRLGQ